MTELDGASRRGLRGLPGVRAKARHRPGGRGVGGGDWYAGPGDDGAVLPAGEG